MDFKRRGLLLIVKELQLTHDYFLNKPQAFALRGLLILPRSNVENREVIRMLGSSASGELIGAKAQFHDNALFKQTIEGPFSFGLQLSKPVSGSKLTFVLSKLAETVIESAGSLVAAQAIPPLRAGIRESARFFAGNVSKNDPMLLAQEYAEISRQSSHTITMVLRANIAMNDAVKRQGPKAKKKRFHPKPSVKVGDPIARAKIQFKFFT